MLLMNECIIHSWERLSQKSTTIVISPPKISTVKEKEESKKSCVHLLQVCLHTSLDMYASFPVAFPPLGITRHKNICPKAAGYPMVLIAFRKRVWLI